MGYLCVCVCVLRWVGVFRGERYMFCTIFFLTVWGVRECGYISIHNMIVVLTSHCHELYLAIVVYVSPEHTLLLDVSSISSTDVIDSESV